MEKCRMNARTHHVLLIALAALAVAALACGPLGGGAQPTPTLFVLPGSGGETGAGGTGGETGAGGTGGGESGFNGGADLSGLSSYRAVFTVTYSGTDQSGNPVSGNASFTQEYNANPPATHTLWQSTGGESAVGNFEIVQIGDTTYMISTIAGQSQPVCSTVSDAQSTIESSTLSPEDWTSAADMSRAQRITPDETVNGVLAQHYRLTQTEMPNMGGFTNYVLDFWTAVDGGYPVRETLVADGSLGMMGMMGQGNGHIEWTYDVLEINVPVDIQVPPGCGMAGGGDFPMMPDAATVTSMGTILTYTTASPVAD